MSKTWNYGDAYLRHPIAQGETAVFENGSMLKMHDIFNPMPKFMTRADLVFVDPPWNLGNMTSFYTKASLANQTSDFKRFYARLFECINEISPVTSYVEVGKQYLAEFIAQMKKQFRHVTFYNSTYYHKKSNLCYVVRGSQKPIWKMPLDGVDEEDVIKFICKKERYECIADLCVGLGLVPVNAAINGKQFVGTELNPKRLSVALERISDIPAGCYHIQKTD